jgi:glycine/D-amino acid oxidase-like deaminating enzyme
MTNYLSDSRLRVSRRGFLKASGVGAAATAAAASGAFSGLGAVPFSASRAAAQGGWDQEVDIVVAGSGGAGFAAAITAHSLGSDVIVLEKGAYAGGTTLVSGGGMWIPNSTPMREAGLVDDRTETLKYMARYSWPHLYQPEDPTLGLPQYDYDMISTYYDTGSVAMDHLQEVGAATWAMQYIAAMGTEFLNVDYMDHFEENVQPEGRTLVTMDADGNQLGGGGLIAGYVAWAEANGLPVMLNHRVERVVLNDAGQVIGVEVSVNDPAAQTATPEANVDESGPAVAATPELDATPEPPTAQVIAIRARKGVIFGSGGFARNEDMMHKLMPAPYYGGCSAPTNEGDFLRISSSVNAKLGNLSNVWRNEGIFEQAIADTGAYNCSWFYSGDSFLMVNKTGRRFVNEDRNYQDRPMAHHYWDPNQGTWKNLLSFLVYDSRQSQNWPSFPFPADPDNTPYVIKGETLEDLAAAIEERMSSLGAVTKGMQLDENFGANFLDEIQKYNGYATEGVDPDFQRGDFLYDRNWGGRPALLEEWPSADQPNQSMYPLAPEGPYYAIIMAAAAVDTNGGPVINTNAQILTWDDQPVEGLYGAGNCIANPSVNAYWGGGATLGNAHTWGYAAAVHAHNSDEKPV